MKLSFQKLSAPLCAVALLGASWGASAATVTLKYNGSAHGGYVNVNLDSPDRNQPAGGMSLTASNASPGVNLAGNILAWCIELGQNVASTSANVVYNVNASSPSWLGTLTTLINQNYKTVLAATGSQLQMLSTAMQLAIWEVVSGGTNLYGGSFRVDSNSGTAGTAVGTAQNWLNNLGSAASTGNYQIVTLTNGTYQDLVTFQEVAAVPLPGAALLFLSALGVTGATRRKRAAKAEAVAA